MKHSDFKITDLISLAEASEISGLSAAHIRKLVGKRILWGTKIGRVWVTSRQAIEDYTSQPHPTGPKPKIS